MKTAIIRDVDVRAIDTDDGTEYEYRPVGENIDSLPVWANYDMSQEAQALVFWAGIGAMVECDDEALQADYHDLQAAKA